MAKSTGEAFVYYVRKGSLIKIGTTANYRPRMNGLKPDEILAVEPGSYKLEARRHEEFAEDRCTTGTRAEWFRPSPPLLAHIAILRAAHDLPDRTSRRPHQYTLSEAQRGILAGLPPLLLTVRLNTLERFTLKLRAGDDACAWRWATPDRSIGYGRFLLNGEPVGAHVASHIMFVGPVPAGWHVDHVRDRGCTHRDCVWWEHLEAVPAGENSRRAHLGVRQRTVTHCVHGHEFTPDNIYWIGPNKNQRACKTCAKEVGNERYRRLVNPNPDPRAGGLKSGPMLGAMQRAKTHCPQGHEYTPDNIYWIGPNKDGRACKICSKARSNERHSRLKNDPDYLDGRRLYREKRRAAAA